MNLRLFIPLLILTCFVPPSSRAITISDSATPTGTAPDPNDHLSVRFTGGSFETAYGGLGGFPADLDAVGRLIFNTGVGCSGSLLGNGHIITAAHCLTDAFGSVDVTSVTASFFTSSGQQDFTGSQFFVNPGWTGNVGGGFDLGIIRLDSIPSITPLELFTTVNFTGLAGFAGFGLSGTGTTGHAGGVFGALHAGYNDIDALWAISGSPFAFDFDNGLAAQNSLGTATGAISSDLGLGGTIVPIEVMLAPGDSGGPVFVNGRLAGVHSFISTSDFFDLDSAAFNSTFGERGGSTQIAPFSDWVTGVTAVPEPGTIFLLGAGLFFLGRKFRRKSAPQ